MEYIKSKWKKILIILLIILLIVLLYFVFGYKIKYRAKATMILGACETECNVNDYSMIMMNDKLLPNYIELTKNYDVLYEVIEKLELKYSINELSKMIKTVSRNETQMFEISVTSLNKFEVVDIVNEISNILIIKIKEVYKIDNLKLLDISSKEDVIDNSMYIYILIILLSILIMFILIVHLFNEKKIRKEKYDITNKNLLTIDEIKSISFNILKYIKDICDSNSINYYLYCGTLLGAFKYNGFIPWDDDIDVVLLREDYMRLIEILSKNNEGRYKLISIYNHKGCYYQFAKLVDSETVLIEEAKPIEGMGVYVDIIPMDSIPNEDSDKFFKKIELLRKFATARWCSNNSRENKFAFKGSNKSNFNLKISYIKASIFNIITKPLGIRFFAKKLDKYASKYSNCTTDNVCRLLNGYGKKEMIPRKQFNSSKKYLFETEKFSSIKNPDIFLKKVYGNYMEELPKEEQKSHHKIVAYWK